MPLHTSSNPIPPPPLRLGYGGEMSGPSSSFDGGQSPAGMSASGDIGSPSGDTRGSEDNASTPTNSPSNASETAHNDRLIEEAFANGF